MRTAFAATLATLMAASAPAVAEVAPAGKAPGGYVLTPEDLKILNGMFCDVDADGDGRITKPEMAAYGIRQRMGTVVRERAWKAMDVDRNDIVDRAEFMESARAFRTKKDGL